MGAQGSEIITNITKQIHLCTSAPPQLNTQNLLNNPLSFFFYLSENEPPPSKKKENYCITIHQPVHFWNVQYCTL